MGGNSIITTAIPTPTIDVTAGNQPARASYDRQPFSARDWGRCLDSLPINPIPRGRAATAASTTAAATTTAVERTDSDEGSLLGARHAVAILSMICVRTGVMGVQLSSLLADMAGADTVVTVDGISQAVLLESLHRFGVFRTLESSVNF